MNISGPIGIHYSIDPWSNPTSNTVIRGDNLSLYMTDLFCYINRI